MSSGSWCVYMLLCDDGTYYTGATNNLSKRVMTHNEGEGAKYTKGRGPVTVAWKKMDLIRSDALKLEYRVKQLTKKQKEDLINGVTSVKDLITTVGGHTG